MELREYLNILWRRKWIIAITTAVAVAVAIFATSRMAPRYEASTTLRILTATTGSADYVTFDTDYTDRLMSTYAAYVNTRPVLSELAARLGTAKAPSVRAELAAKQELFTVTVEDEDPVLAARAANILPEILKARAAWDEQARVAAGLQPTTFLVVEEAVVPESPSSPRKPFNIALGLALGLVGGLGLAFLLQNLDTRLHSVEQVNKLLRAGAPPVLAAIPPWRRRPRLETLESPDSRISEALRSLRTRLQLAAGKRRPGAIVVTAPESQKWVPVITANLAVAFAQAGQRVILVDGNMHSPRQHEIFRELNLIGVSSLLLNPELGYKDVVTEGPHPGLKLLLAGPEHREAIELMTPERLDRLIGHLRRLADVVIIDTPPLLQASDAMALAAAANSALVVAQAGHTREDILNVTLARLQATGVNLLGVVLNGATDDIPHVEPNAPVRVGSGPAGRRSLARERRISVKRDGYTIPRTRGLDTRRVTSTE